MYYFNDSYKKYKILRSIVRKLRAYLEIVET
jgi:hypothetical protein